MSTTTRNEAAERLLEVIGQRRYLQAHEKTAIRNSIRAFAAAERRATVERIRQAFSAHEYQCPECDNAPNLHSILDEEAHR